MGSTAAKCRPASDPRECRRRIDPPSGHFNTVVMITDCPRCGERLKFFMQPRYDYSDEPGSAWADFLGGLSLNRCKCGLPLNGNASTFHTDTWTAVTLEPPGPGYPAEIFARLADDALTGVEWRPSLLLFKSFDEIHQAVSGGPSQPFLFVPFRFLIYQDVSETARALNVLIAAAVRVGLCEDAYLFIKNAAVIHPDIFWFFSDVARELARIVDEASTGHQSLSEDFASVSNQLAAWRKASSLDRERVYVCFPETDAEADASGGQTYYALRGYFDAHQELKFLEGEKPCSLPPWLSPKPALSPAHKCLLDAHIHAAGEFLLEHGTTASQTVSEQMHLARERILNRYADLSEAQRTQVREFYNTVGGRELLHIYR